MLDNTPTSEFEPIFRKLVDHAWEREVTWTEIVAWSKNFTGEVFDQDEEQLHGLFALSRFMYFGKRMIRVMLRSIYREHFESPLIQRIRRNLNGTKDSDQIRKIYRSELATTRFLGIGNPAESGAHLLYYFRQVNRLHKELFTDFHGAFTTSIDRFSNEIKLSPREGDITRYVFFDDLVGSGTQASDYLRESLKKIRHCNSNLEVRFISLFATSNGLKKMNSPELFNGNAITLFELDDTYKAFEDTARYFSNPPDWFDKKKLLILASMYGEKLQPKSPLGYKDGQLLLGFTHNTPDNTAPIFWDEGSQIPWAPIFVRYDKHYEGSA